MTPPGRAGVRPPVSTISNHMLGFMARRAVLGLAVLFVFLTAVFFLVNLLIPFDYAYTFTHELGGAAQAEALREELGLDRPVYLLYFEFVGDLARGSLGTSFSGASVGGMILSALPVTLLVFGVGGIFAFLLGIWLGRFVAWHRSRAVSGLTTAIGVLLYTAFPPLLVFVLVRSGSDLLLALRRWLGLPIDSMRLWQEYWSQGIFQSDVLAVVGIGLFLSVLVAMVVRAWARRNGWRMVSYLAIPSAFVGVVLGVWALGIGPLATDATLFRAAGGVLGGSGFAVGEGSPAIAFIGEGQGSPLILTFAFLLLAFGEVMFVMRTGMAEEMREDYVLTARAKGAPEFQVRDRHVARNAVLPAVSRFFMGIPWMLTGLIIIEREMAVFGLSTVFFGAVTRVDTPLIVGTLVAMGILGLVVWLALEVMHAALDPRVRLEETR